jgi:hypothetical protein
MGRKHHVVPHAAVTPPSLPAVTGEMSATLAGASSSASGSIQAQPSSLQYPTQSPSYTPIIPGAAGFGMNTLAGFATSVRGDGCNVYFVDRLSTTSSGGQTTGAQAIAAGGLLPSAYYGDGTGLDGKYPPAKCGSIQWCINQPGPRVVLAAISGIVPYSNTQTSHVELQLPHRTTVAFQTAPSPGLHTAGAIWVAGDGNGTSTKGDHCLLWHIGATVNMPSGTMTGGAISNGDCYRIHGSNVVVANCSGGYAADETMEIGVSPDSKSNITVWQCLFNQAIQIPDLTGPGAYSSYAVLAYNVVTNLSLLRNVSMFCRERNPFIKCQNATVADWLSFNHSSALQSVGACRIGTEYGRIPQYNIEEAIGIDGPDGSAGPVTWYDGSWPGTGQCYITGTQQQGCSIGAASTANAQNRITSVYPTGYVTTASIRTGIDPATGLTWSLKKQALLRLNNAGPRPKDAATYVDSWRNYLRNWLDQNGQTYGSVPTSWQANPTVAVNTVNLFAGADPIPYASRNTVDSGQVYTRLELWLHRKNLEVAYA